MAGFLTSLSFLYLLTAILMLAYGMFYYRNFIRNGYQPRLFPWLFLFLFLVCLAFLWLSFEPRHKKASYSNLDHHFLKHVGFRSAGQLILGRTDSSNRQKAHYNEFRISRRNGQSQVISSYSEEPFYQSSNGVHRLVSVSWPAPGHTISFQADSIRVALKAESASRFSLSVNDHPVAITSKQVRRAVNALHLFQDDSLFAASGRMADEKVSVPLQHVWLLRNTFSGKDTGQLCFFVSSRLFTATNNIQYDDKQLKAADNAFTAAIPDGNQLGWGGGYPEINRNQYFMQELGADSFRLVSRYPASYPLTEENRPGTERKSPGQTLLKFLVSDDDQIRDLPAVLEEGFLFPAFPGDSSTGFAPTLLAIQKARAGSPLQMLIMEAGAARPVRPEEPAFLLPARQHGLAWEFSVEDSFNWKLGDYHLTPLAWKGLITGSLFFFFILVFFTSFLYAPNRLSWVWQVLSCISLLLLTTRFFLYWRYKSFPPFEGLDRASLQQINSPWNFYIIVIAALLLGIVFGFKGIRMLFHRLRSLLNRRHRPVFDEEGKELWQASFLEKWPWVQRTGIRTLFWCAWLGVLGLGAGLALISHFDPAICRHLAIGLVLLYFLFTYTATLYSPLLASAGRKWWELNSSKKLEMLISNPAKLLLSLSLLALFAFIDIGFALVFLNFLLFNETFLLLNFSIAGLSAGSRGNAVFFGGLALLFAIVFSLNLVYGPYLFRMVLAQPQWVFTVVYVLLALLISYTAGRLLLWKARKKWALQALLLLLVSGGLLLFFPREKIKEKAAMTRYRIDVLTMPAQQAIEKAYQEGDGYAPVIRAAQNQWFINTFIDATHNPGVYDPAFRLLPHAPQNRGARYNAQATDLVTSRFFIAEHGYWSVLFYMLLLLLPVSLLASFYRLYPDFTNRINPGLAAVTTGFSLLNYLLVTALLVVLAATGRYIFFGQDLPFGSILSKQSILFPVLLIIGVVLFFRNIPLQQYPNRLKLIPGIVLFAGLSILLFGVRPRYNKGREFAVAELAANLDTYIQDKVQPLLDEIDSAASTRRLPLSQKDRLFTARLHSLSLEGAFRDAPAVLQSELRRYMNTGFRTHLDGRNMLYLGLNTGKPVLSANEHFFHIEPPPHLQQSWRGGIWGDSSALNISLYHISTGARFKARIDHPSVATRIHGGQGLDFLCKPATGLQGRYTCMLLNETGAVLQVEKPGASVLLRPGDSLVLTAQTRCQLLLKGGTERVLLNVEPDAFMKNYFVNGSRYYHYPLGAGFIWARNFAEGIAPGYTGKGKMYEQVYLSMSPALTDSLISRIREMMDADTSYPAGAEYGICIADGKGRIWAMPDYIKGFNRPDPNGKSEFSRAIRGNNGFIAQSELRKLTGNINLLRLNPGPGSTLKPVVFSAVASQLPLDWNALSSAGFDGKQEYFGGEKVAPYDFEKNNGQISTVKDYIRYSDNYYHSNLLLLGSYSRQELQALLLGHFMRKKPAGDIHWPWFTYKGQTYGLSGFEHWPGYADGIANFGDDSSFVSLGLNRNFGIHTRRTGRGYDPFTSAWDSTLFGRSHTRSGFILPEYALFDQKGTGMHPNKPNELFMSAFRGHVKGSSQVMIPPLKMLDAFGKLVSQDRNFTLTLNPSGNSNRYEAFDVDQKVGYAAYLDLLKEGLFPGMQEALYNGTAARLGALLKGGSPYFYYAKTGTTGDDELRFKSKLFAVVISKKEMTKPGFNFRDNRFVVVYFTSQKGPAKQQEAFQAAVIRLIERTPAFREYMHPETQ